MNLETTPTRQLFVSLEGQPFSSYAEFDAAVREALRRHRAAFPLTYNAQQAIRWGRQNGWIHDTDEGLRVTVA